MQTEEIWYTHYIDDDDAENAFWDLAFSKSSSDEDGARRRGGSKLGKAPNKFRDHKAGARRLYEDYFAEIPRYDEADFRRRFRLSRGRFLQVYRAVLREEKFFLSKPDALGIRGISALQKVTAALRMLAYGIAADAVDEYLRLSETTALKSLKKFVESLCRCFGKEYLRGPNEEELRDLLKDSERRGMPGMIASIDCMKWRWKNCPTAWHGQYEGKEGVPVVVLEAIADRNLRIWHHFFGYPGSGNDINVLESSTLNNKLSSGEFPYPTEYKISGVTRTIPYFLSDGIYPRWPIFARPIHQPMNEKEKNYSKVQEEIRKDVERAFGVLQCKWQIIERPSRLWSSHMMHKVMAATIILHNMAVEDRVSEQRDEIHFPIDAHYISTVKIGEGVAPFWRLEGQPPAPPGSIAAMFSVNATLHNIAEYNETRRLLIEHLWEKRGEGMWGMGLDDGFD